MLLKQKVYTSLVVAILLPLTISTWVFSSYIENFLTEKLETSELPTALAEVRNAIELELSGPIEASKAIAQNTMVEQWIREGEPTSQLSDFTAYLSKNKQANDAITAFIVSGNSNNYYTHDGLVRQISKSDDGWFDAFIRSNKEYELSLDIDKALGEAAVFINYAIVVDGRRVALGGVGRSLTAMTQLVKSYTLAKSGFVYLVDKKGVIQLHPNTDLIGKSINLSEIQGGKIAELDKQGREVVLSSMELDSLGWHLVAEIPKAELFDAINYAIIQNVILGLIIAAIGLALVQLLAKQIFLPLDRIHQSVTNLTDKDGDLTARIKVKEDN
jgi:methyl-accepting chemotaxis protein